MRPLLLLLISVTSCFGQLKRQPNDENKAEPAGSEQVMNSDSDGLPAMPGKRFQNGWVWSKSGVWYYVGFTTEDIFPRRKVTYAVAKDFCENTLGASLPVITTLDRDDKIWELSRVTEIRNFWMALRKTRGTEFDWAVPYNVADSDFTNWCTTNDRCTTFNRNATEVTEECVTYEATLIKLGKFKSGDEIHRFSGHWNPRDCNEGSDVICQYIPQNEGHQPAMAAPSDTYHNMLYYDGYWYTVISDPLFRIPKRINYTSAVAACEAKDGRLPFEDHERHLSLILTLKSFFERNVASNFYVTAGKMVNGERIHNRLNRFSKHQNFEENACILLNLTGNNYKTAPESQYQVTACMQDHYVICELKQPDDATTILTSATNVTSSTNNTSISTSTIRKANLQPTIARQMRIYNPF